MKVQDLIERLKEFPPDMEIMVLDGFNGGGCPREINLGPAPRGITAENAEEAADCEGRVDEEVVVLGFGCY